MPKNKTGILSKMNKGGNQKLGKGSSLVTWTALILVGMLFLYFAIMITNQQNSTQNTTQRAENFEKRTQKDPLKPLAAGSTQYPNVIGEKLENGNFQAESISPWFYLDNQQWGGFSVEQQVNVATGENNRFARIDAHTTLPVESLKVFGAVQEWNLNGEMPSKLNFKMRIHDENIMCKKQYAQAVVIYFVEGKGNVQLRTVLHGTNVAPYNMSNARFHMNPTYTTSPEGWREYSLPILQWFKEGFPEKDAAFWKNGKVRLLMEARYDAMPKNAEIGKSALVVDYDDITFQ